MRAFVVRGLHALLLIALVSVVVFALLHLAPGGPLAIYLENPNVRPADIARIRAELGLDRPLGEQYVRWATSFVRGEWGYSFVDGRPVTTRLWERVPASLELMSVGLLIALALSIPVGVIAAVRRRRWQAPLISALTVAGISLPAFWFALLLQLVFSVTLGLLPSSGRGSVLAEGIAARLPYLILPAAVLGLLHAATWTRYVRTGMHAALQQRFVAAARARGASARSVTYRHALRNALLPLITVVLLDASIMVSGAVVTESVFAWPGLGSLFVEALSRRDYPVLMAFLMAASVAVIVLNAVADFLYGVADPRTRA